MRMRRMGRLRLRLAARRGQAPSDANPPRDANAPICANQSFFFIAFNAFIVFIILTMRMRRGARAHEKARRVHPGKSPPSSGSPGARQSWPEHSSLRRMDLEYVVCPGPAALWTISTRCWRKCFVSKIHLRPSPFSLSLIKIKVSFLLQASSTSAAHSSSNGCQSKELHLWVL
jgi:hypothetical protein